MFVAIMSCLNPGDEVIMIEPFFDIYLGAVEFAGATARYIPLKADSDNPKSSSEFKLDMDELRSMMNEKTKAIVVNTPQNPTGKVS